MDVDEPREVLEYLECLEWSDVREFQEEADWLDVFRFNRYAPVRVARSRLLLSGLAIETVLCEEFVGVT